MINLNKILDNYYKKILKINGIYVSDRMSSEDMDEFYKEIWLAYIPLDIVNEILDVIDNYTSSDDSTNIYKFDSIQLTEYTFHYSLFDYGNRIININLK